MQNINYFPFYKSRTVVLLPLWTMGNVNGAYMEIEKADSVRVFWT